jgi:hypothetical protein
MCGETEQKTQHNESSRKRDTSSNGHFGAPGS